MKNKNAILSIILGIIGIISFIISSSAIVLIFLFLGMLIWAVSVD